MIYTGSMENLLNSYRIIKGKTRELTAELNRDIIGLRKTEMGFEGLIDTTKAMQYDHCILDPASIDDIVICISRGGTKK